MVKQWLSTIYKTYNICQWEVMRFNLRKSADQTYEVWILLYESDMKRAVRWIVMQRQLSTALIIH